MPITVEEKFGRTLSDLSAERTYIVRGTNSDTDARTALETESPQYLDDFSLKREEAEVEEIGVDMWLGTVRYRPVSIALPEVGESTFAFETRGGTQHITQSLQTVNSYAASGTAPNFKGAIGVTEDGVQGCDIVVPVYTFSETHYLAPDAVTNTYKGTLFNLTGKVNDASFKGLAAGECLFLGAAGTQRGENPWEINYAFAGSPNITGLSVGDIAGIAKKGWEYLWVRYQTAEDATAKVLIYKPLAAYVERVYRDGDFALLGIGT